MGQFLAWLVVTILVGLGTCALLKPAQGLGGGIRANNCLALILIPVGIILVSILCVLTTYIGVSNGIIAP